MDKEKMVKDLRAMADFLEQKEFTGRFGEVPVYIFCDSKEIFSKNVAAMGSFAKSADSWINATKRFGNVKLEVTAERSVVCEKVKVGEKIIPATEEQIIPAKPERKEDIYEYKCPESFIGLSKEKQYENV